MKTHTPAAADIVALRARAKNLRRHMLTMASGKGEGYIASPPSLILKDDLASINETRFQTEAINTAYTARYNRSSSRIVRSPLCSSAKYKALTLRPLRPTRRYCMQSPLLKGALRPRTVARRINLLSKESRDPWPSLRASRALAER